MPFWGVVILAMKMLFKFDISRKQFFCSRPLLLLCKISIAGYKQNDLAIVYWH